MQKKQRLAAEVAAESGVDIVFLDIDGVLLPFEPSEQYSTDEDAVTCWECSDQEKEDRATWQCDVCSRCFCSACRWVFYVCTAPVCSWKWCMAGETGLTSSPREQGSRDLHEVQATDLLVLCR